MGLILKGELAYQQVMVSLCSFRILYSHYAICGGIGEDFLYSPYSMQVNKLLENASYNNIMYEGKGSYLEFLYSISYK